MFMPRVQIASMFMLKAKAAGEDLDVHAESPGRLDVHAESEGRW